MDLSSEIQIRQDNVRIALAERGLSCAVLTSPQNFTYLTGLRFEALMSSSARSLVCIVPSEGPVHLIVPGFVSAEAGNALGDAHITSYNPPLDDVADALILALHTMPQGAVGWEMGPESRSGVTLDSADYVRRSLSDRGMEDIAGVLWGIRMHKSPGEIAAIASASRAGSLAFDNVFAEGISGRSEREIASSLAQHGLKNGADRTEWVSCTSGPGSSHRFVSAPRDRIVEPGDLFWADVGFTSGGYWTDFCRAAVAGSVSDERMAMQATIIEATAVGVNHCRPGTPVSEVAKAIHRRMAKLGANGLDYGRLGHGIGLSSTEPPSIATWDPTILDIGMVVTIEPAISHSSGIYCAEQVVAVTDDEPHVLSTAPSFLTEA